MAIQHQISDSIDMHDLSGKHMMIRRWFSDDELANNIELSRPPNEAEILLRQTAGPFSLCVSMHSGSTENEESILFITADNCTLGQCPDSAATTSIQLIQTDQ